MGWCVLYRHRIYLPTTPSPTSARLPRLCACQPPRRGCFQYRHTGWWHRATLFPARPLPDPTTRAVPWPGDATTPPFYCPPAFSGGVACRWVAFPLPGPHLARTLTPPPHHLHLAFSIIQWRLGHQPPPPPACLPHLACCTCAQCLPHCAPA